VWSQDVRFSKLGVHENHCNIQKLWKQQQQLVETMKQASHQPSEDSCHDQSCSQFIPNAASEQSTCGSARQKKNDDYRNLDYN
jgi:hypothetical protein